MGTILLYKSERMQYNDIVHEKKDVPAAELYGAEHLLRLFVTLPELIANTNMDSQSVSALRENIEDFVR